MIQQQVGDVLEVEQDGRHFYVVVLTKVVQFGGNVVFAFHTDGEKRAPDTLTTCAAGFNICTDLLAPKRAKRVRRVARVADVKPYWRTRLVKATAEYRTGVKARDWYIYRVSNLGKVIAHTTTLDEKQRHAMDDGCHSFDLVAEKVLARYTPDQNEHL